jgi:hypothetical protein
LSRIAIATAGDRYTSISGSALGKIPEGIVERKKSLSVASRLESAHLPFSLVSRLMRDFGSIVGVSRHSASHVVEDASYGSGVVSSLSVMIRSGAGSQRRFTLAELIAVPFHVLLEEPDAV